jgi:hypothetical protein
MCFWWRCNMKGLEKTGGVAALVLAVSFIVLILEFLVVLPGMGFVNSSDFMDPAKFFGAAASLRVWFTVTIVLGAAVALVTLGLREHLRESNPAISLVSTAAGLGGAIFLLANGMFSYVAITGASAAYAMSPANVSTGDLVLGSGVADGLFAVGTFTFGWFALLSSVAFLRSGVHLPIGYFGLVTGAIFIVSFAISPFMAVLPFFGLVWAAWLGYDLLTEPAGAHAPRTTTPRQTLGGQAA